MAALKSDYMLKTQHLDAPLPPSYDLVARSSPESSLSTGSTALTSFSSGSSSQSHKFKPIVIPQTSKSFRGAFFSPFLRVWPPCLSSLDITEFQFLNFMDGLNEAFIAHPAFTIASVIGGVMVWAPAPINYAGIGLQVGAGVTSAATSWTRAKAFVKDANENIFLPKGLRVKVLKTKKMMAHVGHEGEVLQLPPLEMDPRVGAGWGDEENDPRMRRMRALEDKVAELQFYELPAPEEFGNWWKKMGSKQAQRRDAKTTKRIMKNRDKAWKKNEEAKGKAEKEARKYDKEIRKIERDMQKEQAKAEKKLNGRKGADSEKRAEVEYDLQKEMRKLDHEMDKALREKEKKVGEEASKGQKEIMKVDKEGRVAMKIYWVVIDKDEEMGHKFPCEEDVESEESEE